MEKEWFVYQKDHHKGPFDIEDINRMFSSGDLLEADLVWKEGLSDWTFIRNVKPCIINIPREKIIQIKPVFVDEDELPPDLPDLPDEAYEDCFLPPIPDEEVDEAIEVKDVSENVELGLEKVQEPLSEIMTEYEPEERKKKHFPFFFTGLVLTLLVTFIFLAEDKPVPEKISSSSKLKLEKIIKYPPSSGVKFRAVPFENSKGLWVATNFDGILDLSFSLKSLPNKILSKNSVKVHGFFNTDKSWGKLNEWTFDSGVKLYPGYYELNLHGNKRGLLNRIYIELKKLPYFKEITFIKNYQSRVEYKDKILMSSLAHSEFNKKLNQFWSAINRKKSFSFEEKAESYRTFDSLLDQIFYIYKSTIRKIVSIEEIDTFEIKYAKTIGPMMRALILQNYHLYEKLKFKAPNDAKEYFHLFEYGKGIGEMVSSMVTYSKKVNVLNPKTKLSLVNKYRSEVDSLKLKGGYHLKELERALPQKK